MPSLFGAGAWAPGKESMIERQPFLAPPLAFDFGVEDSGSCLTVRGHAGEDDILRTPFLQ